MTEGQPNAVAVRQELAKLLASTGFVGSERLSRFLSFVVEESLSGRSGSIKDYAVGVEVYRKDASYDPATDSLVRVEASRLRSKLAKYYETEGRADPVQISLPKGAYVPA